MESVHRGIGYLGLGISLIYLAATARLPAAPLGDSLGPKPFPALLGLALLVLSAALVAGTFGKGRPGLRRRPGAGAPGLRALLQDPGRRSVLAAVGWLVVYAAAFPWAGYAVSTALACFGLMRLVHRGAWLPDLAVAAGFSLFMYGLFRFAFAGSLPAGWLALLRL